MSEGRISLYSLGESAPRTTRGVPYAERGVFPNSQQQRAEEVAADAMVPTAGLDVAMATVTPGAGVPIVFCKEVDGVGGVWVSPPCVQYGFIVDASDNVTINYTVVIGQGEYPAIPDADVYYGAELFNTLPSYSLVQEYETLPYNVNPATVIDGSATVEVPSANGTGGTFEDVSLLGCYAELAAPATWDRQVHVFMRNGVEVSRYVEGTTGSSSNFADLVRYLLEATGEVPDALIDHTSLETSGQFLAAMGLQFSGILSGTALLDQYIAQTAPLFLCTSTDNQGKKGILPALALADDFTADTEFLSSSQSYTMGDIVAGTFRIQYVPATERKPFQAVMSWRDPQQPGAVSQTTVAYSKRAANGPYERYDLSAFCVSEEQAIKVGRYILAQRLYVGHSISCQLLPNAAVPSVGDLIDFTRDVLPNGAASRREAYMYRVTSVSCAVDGSVSIVAVHYPRDAQGTSQIAQEIINAPVIEAQTPEDWSDLPPYDLIVPPAVVGGSDYIAATGGFIHYQGDYKYHIFSATRSFVANPSLYLYSEPDEPYLMEYISGVPVYYRLSIGGQTRLLGYPRPSIMWGYAIDTTYAYRDSFFKTASWRVDSTFRILSAPIGGTFDVLVVGGGGAAFSPGFACFQPGGGGQVVETTLAATVGFYPVRVGPGGFVFGTQYGGSQEYLGQSLQRDSSSAIAYYAPGDPAIGVPDPTFPATPPILVAALGGINAFTGTYPTFTQDASSGTGNARGTAISSTYGGGGGAGGDGSNAVSSSVGGAGGAGVVSSFFGAPVEFGGGGGGGVGDTAVPSPTAGQSLLTFGCGGGGLNGVQAHQGTHSTVGYGGRDGIVAIKYRYKG